MARAEGLEGDELGEFLRREGVHLAELEQWRKLALVDGVACDGGSFGTAAPVATKTGDAMDVTPEVKPEPTPDAKPEVKPDATPEVKPEPPPPEPLAKTTMNPDLVADEPPRQTCPSGTWCGILHPPPAGPDTALGCPSQVTPAVKPIAGEAPSPGGERTSFDAPLTTSTRASGTDDACCDAWVRPCPGGRPLLDDGRVVSASLGAVDTTMVATRTPHAEGAAAWMRDAADEYASVASFARAAIELMAVRRRRRGCGARRRISSTRAIVRRSTNSPMHAPAPRSGGRSARRPRLRYALGFGLWVVASSLFDRGFDRSSGLLFGGGALGLAVLAGLAIEQSARGRRVLAWLLVIPPCLAAHALATGL